MNNRLRWFDVTCIDDCCNLIQVKVMTFDEFSAKRCAENSLLEGKSVKVKAIQAKLSRRPLRS